MRRSYVLVVTAVIVGLLSAASLLAGLRHALERRERHAGEPSPERERVRRALRGMLTTINPSLYPENLRPEAGLPVDRWAYLESLPRLDPPLSQTVREDRDARG
jgi:hypothetical protein